MKSFISLLFLVMCFAIAIGTEYPTPATCPPCYSDECDEIECEFEYGFDMCGCCPVCLKGQCEKCGGNNDMFGVCAGGLSCIPVGNAQSDNAVGRCQYVETTTVPAVS